MRLLVLDIETSPSLVYTWGLFDQTIGISQVVKPTEVICFAAQFVGEKKMHFASVYHDGKAGMVDLLWSLFDDADVVIGYNSKGFDVKHIQREFLEMGLHRPTPFQQVDLFHVVKQNFRFLSNKLDWVSQRLDIGHKAHHEGFGLWEKCLANDDAAWARMKRYNIQDVKLTMDLYLNLRPWITTHPNVALDSGTLAACPTCGSDALTKRGFHRTRVSTFQRFCCTNCGSYSHSGKRASGADLR